MLHEILTLDSPSSSLFRRDRVLIGVQLCCVESDESRVRVRVFGYDTQYKSIRKALVFYSRRCCPMLRAFALQSAGIGLIPMSSQTKTVKMLFTDFCSSFSNRSNVKNKM